MELWHKADGRLYIKDKLLTVAVAICIDNVFELADGMTAMHNLHGVRSFVRLTKFSHRTRHVSWSSIHSCGRPWR